VHQAQSPTGRKRPQALHTELKDPVGFSAYSALPLRRPTSTPLSAFTPSTHFRGTTVSPLHIVGPPSPLILLTAGLDVFPRHAAEGLASPPGIPSSTCPSLPYRSKSSVPSPTRPPRASLYRPTTTLLSARSRVRSQVSKCQIRALCTHPLVEQDSHPRVSFIPLACPLIDSHVLVPCRCQWDAE
jgi:hypothetical protein